MRQQRIGPLPLLSGLELEPAQGKPTGLLRALNVEARDGLVQTRRGQTLLSASPPGFGAAAAGFTQPAVWAGATVVYIGTDLAPADDAILSVVLSGGAGGTDDPTVDDVVTYDFWGDDQAWHSLEVMSAYDILNGKWFLGAAGASTAFLTFVVPYGWRNDQPPGTPSVKRWIRITRTNAWVTPIAITLSFANPPLSTQAPRPKIIAPATRGGRGPFVAAPFIFGAGTFLWGVTAMDAGGYTMPVIPYDGTPARMLYIAAVDKVLVSLSGGYYIIDCKLAPTDAGAFSAFIPYAPSALTDGPYDDIGLETALPGSPSAMCIFGGRVFIAGFASKPQAMMWSAPGAYYDTFPSTNFAILGGGASGQIMALIPIDQTLYVFTSTGIWRALLGDPTAGNESNLFIDIVEETPCCSAESVVAINKAVVFLSHDGPRIFNGSSSKLLDDGIIDLFRPDSEQALACIRKDTGVAVWHPIENQYRLSYASPGALHNDTILMIDLGDRTSWLWGSEPVGNADIGAFDPTLVSVQRPRGVRIAAMAWDQRSQAVIGVDPEGTIVRLDSGPKDVESVTRWYAESQNLRTAAGERAVVGLVEVQVQREHFKAMKVSVIPDGDRARADSKTIAVQSDALDTTEALGSAPLTGTLTPLQLDASMAPLRARFRKAGRNHRVRVESVAPNHDPIKILTITCDLSIDEKPR